MGTKFAVGARGGAVVIGLVLGTAQDHAPLDGLSPFLIESSVPEKRPIHVAQTRNKLS